MDSTRLYNKRAGALAIIKFSSALEYLVWSCQWFINVWDTEIASPDRLWQVMLLLPSFTLPQLTELLIGLAGMKQPAPGTKLAKALPLAVQEHLKALASPPLLASKGPVDDHPPSEGALLTPVSVPNPISIPSLPTRTRHPPLLSSGQRVTCILTWAAAIGETLPYDWLQWYSSYILRCIRHGRKGSPNNPPVIKQGLLLSQRQGQRQRRPGYGPGVSRSQGAPPPHLERSPGLILPPLRPRDQCDLLEAFASLKRRGLLPLSAEETAASSVSSNRAGEKATQIAQLSSRGASPAVIAPAGLSRLIMECLIPAATCVARRQLAEGPLVARTCAAISGLLRADAVS